MIAILFLINWYEVPRYKGGNKIAKYIDVKIMLEKTIKVDTDDLVDALKIAKSEYPNLELTQEWLNARNVTIGENPIIDGASHYLAELCHEDFDKESLNDILDIIYGHNEIRDYIYNETMEILKDKYHVNITDIKI